MTQSPTRVWTKDAWEVEGTRRFGPDMLKWRFRCPSCGNVASPEDFRQFKDKGATPNSATANCIGRYTGAKTSVADLFGKHSELPQPCNYAAYGLLRFGDTVKADDGHDTPVFPFADEQRFGGAA